MSNLRGYICDPIFFQSTLIHAFIPSETFFRSGVANPSTISSAYSLSCKESISIASIERNKE